jgi:hypothetical protein
LKYTARVRRNTDTITTSQGLMTGPRGECPLYLYTQSGSYITRPQHSHTFHSINWTTLMFLPLCLKQSICLPHLAFINVAYFVLLVVMKTKQGRSRCIIDLVALCLPQQWHKNSVISFTLFRIQNVDLLTYLLNPWPQSASELYRPSDCRSSAKLVPTSADRGCHVVGVTSLRPYSRISRPNLLCKSYR